MKKYEYTYDYPNKLAEVLYTEHKFDFYDFFEINGWSEFYVSGLSVEEKANGIKKPMRVKNRLVVDSESPDLNEQTGLSEIKTRLIDDKTELLSLIDLGDSLMNAGLLVSSKQLDVMFNSFARDNNQSINDEESWNNAYHKFAKGHYNKVFKEIEGWLHEYGLPFYEDGKTDKEDPESVYTQTGVHVCNLGTMIDWLMNLYSNFHIWRYAQFEEKSEWLNEENCSLEHFAFYLKKNQIGNDIQYQLLYQKNTDSIDFFWTSDNLLVIAELQIALLASSKDPDGKSIKRCHKCGDWFEADNNNEIYCKKRPGCNAKAVAQSRWRNKKKV